MAISQSKIVFIGVVVAMVSLSLMTLFQGNGNEEIMIGQDHQGDAAKPWTMETIDNAESGPTVTNVIMQDQVFVRIGHPKVETGPPVLLLHGARFSSKTWEDLGTLAFLAERGFYAVALDLPGFGETPRMNVHDNAGWLDQQIRVLFQHKKPVLVSPSMSGRFSVPLVLEKGRQVLHGFVPIAPVQCEGKDFSKVEGLPTLILRGANDAAIGLPGAQFLRRIPQAQEFVVEHGTHAFYVDDPQIFHEQLLQFLAQL